MAPIAVRRRVGRAALCAVLWCGGIVGARADGSSARIDLFDPESGRAYLVVYYDTVTHAGNGMARFTRPRALFLPEEGDNLDAMLRAPVAELCGEAGRYDPATGTFTVERAHTIFRMLPGGELPGGSPAANDPVEVEADVFDASPREATGVYRGAVRLRRQGMALACERLEVRWDVRARALLSARASGRPAVATRASGERLAARLIEVDFPRRRIVCPPGAGGRIAFSSSGRFWQNDARSGKGPAR